jgi:plastocyanin
MRILPAALLALIVTAPAAWAGDAKVTIKDYMFTPMTLTVAAGTRVVWTNADQAAHTVKSADDATPFASPPLDPGESYSRVFDKPGTYHILCGLHPYMKETIMVR